MMSRTRRGLSTLAALLAATTLGSTGANATVITTNCASATSCTLSELFERGGTIQVDDKLFDSWKLESGNLFDANLGDVTVGGIEDPLNTGIVFKGELEALGRPEEVIFGYKVSVVGAPLVIEGASLMLNDFELQGDAAALKITESIANGGPLAELGVFSDGVTNQLSDAAAFPDQTALAVRTQITLAPEAKDALVRLGVFEQRFRQTRAAEVIPEPSAAFLFMGGGVLVARSLRRRKS